MLNLMSPGEIGSLKLKNRIVMAPMGPHFGDIDRKAVEYFSARARGGAAMILVNMTVTDYIVKCALGKNVRQTDELAPILSELKAQGRNLNQLAKLANMGRIDLVDAENFTEAYTNLYGLIEEIYWEGE